MKKYILPIVLSICVLSIIAIAWVLLMGNNVKSRLLECDIDANRCTVTESTYLNRKKTVRTLDPKLITDVKIGRRKAEKGKSAIKDKNREHVVFASGTNGRNVIIFRGYKGMKKAELDAKSIAQILHETKKGKFSYTQSK